MSQKKSHTANSTNPTHPHPSKCTSELDSASNHFGRNYRRRPDRHPFVIDVPSSIFFSSRAMPKTNTRYPMVVGETFWRLASYIDSVPSRLEERIQGKPPHILVRGLNGCGKSYLMATASALLGYGPQNLRPKQLSYLSCDYRTVFIGDCKRWLESDDPLTYFRMELLAGIRDESQEVTDHYSADHLGCLVCVEPFTRVDQVKQYMEKCCRWISENQPDTLFIFFIDQAEELIGRTDSIPYQIIMQLINVSMPLLVFSVSSQYAQNFPFKNHCGTIIEMPYRVTSSEFAKHFEVHGGLEDKTISKDIVLWKDLRLWTGSVPSEIAEALKLPGSGIIQKLQAYRKSVIGKMNPTLLAINSLNPKQRNVLLIVIFAIVLRVPMDMSGDFNLSNIMSLGPTITRHFLLNCYQSFYHSSDGIVTMRGVPATPSMSEHLALCSVNVLNSIFKTWPTLFENVVHAILQSKLLCVEAKRRMSRFYSYSKFLWGKQEWSFEGQTEMGESLSFKLRQPRVIIFAGQVPIQHFFTSNGPDTEHHGVPGNGDYDSIVFIPGRTSYWFFDLFILVPEDRRLYAVTTSSVVGTWLKELQSRHGPIQVPQHREDGLLTPSILLDHWKDSLKKAGLTKINIKCCVVKTLDLMLAAGYSPPPITNNESETVVQLAQQLESTVTIKDEDSIND